MGITEISPRELRTQGVFAALMWSLSYPGRPQRLPGCPAGPFVAIAEALIDLETSYYTPDRALLFQLSASGARALGQETALYQFYPGLQDADLAGLAAAPRGTPLAPDQSATLVIGCRFGVGTRQQWSGPGIRTRLEVVLAGLPDAFWPARQAAGPYPLGWDVFFVDSDHVLGLPRTTQVEVSRWHM